MCADQGRVGLPGRSRHFCSVVACIVALVVTPNAAMAAPAPEGGVEFALGVELVPAEGDRDGDGLSDEEEAIYQTDLDVPDTDGDGLLDGWEVHGVVRNGAKEPLGLFGANPQIPDVFVEIDWMESADGDPDANAVVAYHAAIDVWRIFRAKGRGMRIHFDLGAGIEARIPPEEIEDDAPDFSRFEMSSDAKKVVPYRDRFPRQPTCGEAQISPGSLYGVYRDPSFFRPSRRNVFYYLLIAEEEDPSGRGISGYADDFSDGGARRAGLKPAGVRVAVIYRRHIETEDPDRSRYGFAAAVLHELGHGFGLGHGGALPEGGWDNQNNKPNYPSVMNYRYQLAGVDSAAGRRVAGYSAGLFLPVREDRLSEADGFGPHVPSAHILAHLGLVHLDDPSAPNNIDYNQNGVVDEEPLSLDLDFSASIESRPLRDHDDWGKFLRDGFAGIGRNAFRSRGMPGHFGPEIVLLDGDFDGDGRVDSLLFTGRSIAVALSTNNGPRTAESLTFRDKIGAWNLSIDDEMIVGRFASSDRDEVFFHNGERAALIRFAAGAETLWSGTEAPALELVAPKLEEVFVENDPPSSAWKFSIDDTFRATKLGDDSRDRIFVYRGARAALLDWRDSAFRVIWRDDAVRGPRTRGDPFTASRGRRTKSGDTVLLRSTSALLELGRGATGLWLHEMTVDGRLPGANAKLSAWELRGDECIDCVDLDGDGIEEMILARKERVGVAAEDGDGNLSIVADLDLSSAGGDESFAVVQTIRTGDFAAPEGAELVVVLESAGSEASTWVLLGWDPGARTLRQLGEPTRYLKDPRGFESWPLLARQRVLSGRFFSDEPLAALLVQDRQTVLGARWDGESFVEVARFEDRIGFWTLGEGDLMRLIDPVRIDGFSTIGIENGLVVSWLDLSILPPVAWTREFDTDTAALVDPPVFVRGDVNDDGEVDLSDALTLLIYLFQNRRVHVECLDSGDTDDSGELDITDAIRILAYLFSGGPEPLPPGPRSPGTDPTRDSLGCETR